MAQRSARPIARLVALEFALAVLSDLLGRVVGYADVLLSERFSNARMADRILVLADGRVKASGTHAELMAQRGATRSCSSRKRQAIAETR